MKILNIAAGKQKPLELPPEIKKGSLHSKNLPKHIINIDNGYFDSTPVDKIESLMNQTKVSLGQTLEINCRYDIFEFMERTKIIFDHIVIYRYLEHVSFTQLNYFIYLVSTVIHPGGIVDIIVPNYLTLADMIKYEDPYMKDFEASNIILTTELLNEPSCPHASIWTPIRAKYFWELEGRFKVNLNETEEQFLFDGRDIYLRFFARRA